MANAGPYSLFGAGEVIITPLIDADGATVSNPTPIIIPECQGIEIGIKRDLKQLFGQQAYAVESAHGKGSFPVSFSCGRVYAQAINSMFMQQSIATGQSKKASKVSGTVPAPSGPYTITPTVPDSGTWAEDLGVRTSEGLPLTRVASAPTTGQYSVSAGVYTFAAADSGVTYYFDFRYTVSTGKTITYLSKLMGQTPEVKMIISTHYKGRQAIIRLPRVVASSEFGLSTKLDDYTMPKLNFDAIMESEMTGVVAYFELPV